MKNIQYWLLLIMLLTVMAGGCAAPELVSTELSAEESAAEKDDRDMADAEMQEKQTEFSEEEIPEKGLQLTVSSGQTEIYAHISGAVKFPGVYILAAGERLFELVEAAGGFTEDACEDYCNLAQAVTDGMQYYIPTEEEVTRLQKDGNDSYFQQKMQREEFSAVNAAETADAHLYDADGRLNLNLAGMDELTKLTGIGQTRAQAILTYREENGRFENIQELMKVPGIKEGTFRQIEQQIVIP